MFNIDGLVARIGVTATGHTLAVLDIAKYLNDRGDYDLIKTSYPIEGIVQIATASEDEVKEGILMPMDLICFFDENETNAYKLKNENQLEYDSKCYKIVSVIREIGHVEVLAKKL